jgi:pilus assembly protein TadC
MGRDYPSCGTKAEVSRLKFFALLAALRLSALAWLAKLSLKGYFIFGALYFGLLIALLLSLVVNSYMG